jgi:hypothetical protein
MQLSFVFSATFHRGDSRSIGHAGQRTRFAKTNFIAILSPCYLFHYLSTISWMLKTLHLGLALKKYLVRSPPADGLSGSFIHSQRMNATAAASSAATCSRWFFARGFFYPEDGGDTILLNVGSIDHIYTAPHPRRRHSPLQCFI